MYTETKSIATLNDANILIQNILDHVPCTAKVKKAIKSEWSEIHEMASQELAEAYKNEDEYNDIEEEIFIKYVKDELENLLARHININIRPETTLCKDDRYGNEYEAKLRKTLNGTVEDIFSSAFGENPDVNDFYKFTKIKDDFTIKIDDDGEIADYISDMTGWLVYTPVFKITLV